MTATAPPTAGAQLGYARERTDEGMELILKAWTEPQPFGWQGRHFQYRTVSIWPRPQHQPHPTTYALGTSAEAGDFAARHRIGLGVSYGTFELMAKSTRSPQRVSSRTAYITTSYREHPRGNSGPVLRRFWTTPAPETPSSSLELTAWGAMRLR